MSSPFFAPFKNGIVKMQESEKVGEKSEGVKNAYVNQNAYTGVWKGVVEKIVDNVENSRFSTGIFRFYTAAARA